MTSFVAKICCLQLYGFMKTMKVLTLNICISERIVCVEHVYVCKCESFHTLCVFSVIAKLSCNYVYSTCTI